MKLSPDLAAVYATYLGGSDDDTARAIAIDSSGSAWVVGSTASADFPVSTRVGFGGRIVIGPNHFGDGFAARLSPDGRNLRFATSETPAGCTADTLAAFDLLVLDYNGPRWGEPCEQPVEAFVRGGKGLVAVHGASYAFGGLQILGDRHVRTGLVEPPWREYARVLGGLWVEGPARTGHGKRHVFQVRTVDADHPVMRGLPPSFPQNDELYHRIQMRPEAHVLATAFDSPDIEGTGKDEPILWLVEYGRGRVFQTTLGHDVEAMSSAGFGATLARGAEWAATGRVTLPKPPERQTSILVVTGGHDYDTSFYTLFQNQPDLRWDHRLHRASAEAFGRNLAGKYDALVLYDMAQNITEEEKRRLTAFLDGGGGLVVLHHALASFQNWPEYSRLIGGKYFLQPDPEHAASGFQHNTWIQGQVEDPQHPVTRGLSTFRIYDEVYKQCWVSKEAKVLLTTDHPNSNKALAWISPHPRARVVYIQLGHGEPAHAHPAFRRLVAQAIRWAAGL